MATFFLDVSSTFELTQAAKPEVVFVYITSDLDVLDSAKSQHKIETLSSELELVGQLAPSTLVGFQVDSLVELAQTTSILGTLNVAATSLLSLTSNARSALHSISIVSQLDLQQNAVTKRPFVFEVLSELSVSEFELSFLNPEDQGELKNTVGLRGTASVKGSYNVSATSYFSLAQKASKSEVGIASSHIHLSQIAETVLYEEVTSHLYISQTASVHNTVPSVNELTLTQLSVGNIVGSPNLTNVLNLLSVCSYTTVNFCGYTPGVGEGSFDYTPPSVVAPILTRRPTTVLTWPYTSPQLTVEIRNPTFDNVEQFASRRINRRSLGGELDLYRDESWVKIQRLILSFSSLSEIQRNDLLQFLIRGLGQEVGILDFESRQWRGVILTPSSAISQPKREGYSFSLDFEGSLV